MAVYIDGLFAGIIANAQITDTCSGQLAGTFQINPSSWDVNSPNILSMTINGSTSTMKGLAGGSSSFYTPFNGLDYAWNGATGACFVAAQPQLNPGGNGNVQVPTSAAIIENVKSVYTKQTWTSCDGTESMNNMYGYQRCVIYQVLDQHGDDIKLALTTSEVVTTIVIANASPNAHSGNSSTNAGGQFEDGLALIGTSTLPSNACIVNKQSITVQGNPNPIRVNCLKYGATDVVITDVTSNPSQCSQPTQTCP